MWVKTNSNITNTDRCSKIYLDKDDYGEWRVVVDTELAWKVIIFRGNELAVKDALNKIITGLKMHETMIEL